MDDYIIDPLGDDSDLLDEKDTDDGVFCTDPSHDHGHFDESIIPTDLKTLPKLMPFALLSHSLFDFAIKNRAIQEEQVAIIYSLSELLGRDRFDWILQGCQHYKRYAAWDRVSKICDSVLGDAFIDEFSEGESEGSMAIVILKAHLETNLDIASRLRDMHHAKLIDEFADFDTSIVEGMFSFNEWESESDRFLNQMKYLVKTLITSMNKVFTEGARVDVKFV